LTYPQHPCYTICMLDLRNIETHRRRQGYANQTALARAAGLHPVHWAAIRAGRVREPTLTTCRKLARALGASLESILR